MYATYTTLVGRLVTTPEKRTYDSGVTRVHFRVGCTERRQGSTGWEDGERLYIGVYCWRQLAENVAATLSKGDAVVVHGKIYTRSVEREGNRLSYTEMEASAVGPDLRWATGTITRTKSAAAMALELPDTGPDGTSAEPEADLAAPLDDPWAPAKEADGFPEVIGESSGEAVGSPDRAASTRSRARGAARGRTPAEAAVGT